VLKYTFFEFFYDQHPSAHSRKKKKKKKKDHQKGKKPKQKKKEAKWKTVIIEVKQPVRVVQS